jgi:hypothetical protein
MLALEVLLLFLSFGLMLAVTILYGPFRRAEFRFETWLGLPQLGDTTEILGRFIGAFVGVIGIILAVLCLVFD